ncbi:MAG TPA: multicopper oxidase domain-containing protein [Candidatus Angelobacter sp.]|nr:multicopper oxidase domain-containing protein [Candidatus Angelobacter sp.]
MSSFLLRRILFATAIVLTFPSLGFAAKNRHYYIAAEDVEWDYAPSGRDLIHGVAIPLPWKAQTRWKKTRYIEYTDDTFTTKKRQPDWLGILGPIIRAEVGDTVYVHFFNRGSESHSIHPHGLHYDKDNEGSVYLPYGQGAGVQPGDKFTYKWLADRNSGPKPGQPSSVVWWYHAHVEPEKEINSGLLGPIIVTAAGMADANGAPKDVAQEFVVMFMIFDEQHKQDPGLFHAINGYIFGNLPGLLMPQGGKVRWHMLGMGDERDVHSAHWHGETVYFGSRRTDVIQLLPASMVTVDMQADNPGTWLFECHVSDHMEGGMMATYTIYAPRPSCPVSLAADNWEKLEGTSAIRVRNSTLKPIREISLLSGYMIGPAVEPLVLAWNSDDPIPPGQDRPIEVGTEMFAAKKNLGVAFFPSHILYEDGSEWKPQHLGDCFRIYWREKDHPQLPVLPAFQLSASED